MLYRRRVRYFDSQLDTVEGKGKLSLGQTEAGMIMQQKMGSPWKQLCKMSHLAIPLDIVIDASVENTRNIFPILFNPSLSYPSIFHSSCREASGRLCDMPHTYHNDTTIWRYCVVCQKSRSMCATNSSAARVPATEKKKKGFLKIRIKST